MNRISISHFLLFAISLTSMMALFGAQGEGDPRTLLRERLKGDISNALDKFDFDSVSNMIRSDDRQEGHRYLEDSDLRCILYRVQAIERHESGTLRMATLFLKVIPLLGFLSEFLKVELQGRCSDDALLVERTICFMNPRAQGASVILALNFLGTGIKQAIEQFYRIRGANRLAYELVTDYL